MWLCWVGLVVYIIGAIGLLIDEFKESLLWGLAGLIFQVTHVIFAILHFHECKKNLGVLLLGVVLVVLGRVLVGR